MVEGVSRTAPAPSAEQQEQRAGGEAGPGADGEDERKPLVRSDQYAAEQGPANDPNLPTAPTQAMPVPRSAVGYQSAT